MSKLASLSIALLVAIPAITTANNDFFQVIEDGVAMKIAVLDNDEGEGLSVISVDSPDNGTATIINNEVIYTPYSDYSGVDSFTYTTTDNSSILRTFTVNLVVNASHEQPQSSIDERIAPELSPSGMELVVSKYAKLPDDALANSYTNLGNRIFIATEGTDLHNVKIYEVERNSDGSVTTKTFFDIGTAFKTAGIAQAKKFGGQGGVRSIAFHPDFATNGKLYVSFVVDRPDNSEGINYISDFALVTDIDSVIAEFTYDSALGTMDPDSYRELGRIAMPQQGNHPIKQIKFNPYAVIGDNDYGLLYISVGDGTSNGLNVSRPAAQNNDALGKMLRIDPLEQPGGESYGIPSDNPFVDKPYMLDEVYALGLRNEHTFSFYQDENENTHLISTGVGYDNIDEVNIIESGDNLGWGLREGPFVTGGPYNHAGSGNTEGLEPLPQDDWVYHYRYPATFVAHDAPIGTRGDVFQALSGGFVVTNNSALNGQFIFGDFAISSRLYHVSIDELLYVKTSLNENETPNQLSWATPSELTIYENTDFDTATTPLIRKSFAEVVGNERSDLRFGEGPEGQIFLTNKHDSWVYIVENSVPGTYIPPTNLTYKPTVGQTLIFNGHAYVLEAIEQTWNEANALAHLKNGILLEIDSIEESAAIVDAFVKKNPIWLGFSDQLTEGLWLNSNDEPLTYENWLPGQPSNSNGNQNFAIISSASGYWDDIGDQGGYFYDGGWQPNRENLTIVEYDYLIEASDDEFTIEVGQTAESIAFGSALGLMGNDRYFGAEPTIISVNGQPLVDVGKAVNEITMPGSNGGLFVVTAEGGMVFTGNSDFDHLTSGQTLTTMVTYTVQEQYGETSTATISVTVKARDNKIVEFDGHRYLLSASKGLTWQQAQEEALAAGGKIVEINSAEENSFIFETFGGADNPIWLGFNYRNGDFVDGDGSIMSYVNWLPGEPNNLGTQLYVIMSSSSGQWDNTHNGGGWFYDNSWKKGYLNRLVIEFDDALPSINLLSEGKPTAQSSVLWNAVSSRAVDGNTDGDSRHGSVTHTAKNENQPWWQVDLEATSTIAHINIWNRTDCCSYRARNFSVFISSTDMTGKTYAELQADPSVNEVFVTSLNGLPSIDLQMNNIQGRYVRVQLSQVGVLSLAEVQVYGH